AKEKQYEEELERDNDLYFKSRYLLHQRIGLPFATITFALFAMVLGIQDQRRGKSSAYVGAIATIIAAYIFMMGFKWSAEKGLMSAPLAAWAPNILLLAFGAFV